MAIPQLLPKQPDPRIVKATDQEVAKFGHLKWLIGQINESIATLSTNGCCRPYKTHTFSLSSLQVISLGPGLLTIGHQYRILNYQAGDNFSNVASVQDGTINTTDCVFTATATTPLDWTHGSSLETLNLQAQTMENGIGSTVVQAVGVAGASVAQVRGLNMFPDQYKTFILAGRYSGINASLWGYWVDANTIELRQISASGVPASTMTGDSATVEIRVY